MDYQRTLEFLRTLKSNNSKEWFDANRNEYEYCRDEFIEFVNQLILGISSFDSGIIGLNAKKCMFRINRDIRFSKDKTPYKTNFGAVIAPEGRKSRKSCYYIHIEPGNTFAGGGMYRPVPEDLKRIRKEVFQYGDELEAIINDAGFKKMFGDFYSGDALKRVPVGYPADFKYADWLKLKSYVFMYKLSDKEFCSPTSYDLIVDIYKTLWPFNLFLNQVHIEKVL